MAAHADHDHPAAPVREQVDALAVEILLRKDASEVDAGWIEALRRIADEASGSGWTEAASIARDLAERLGRGAAEPSSVEADISRLQQALMVREPGKAASHSGARGAIAQDLELINDFVLESREHLESIEARLLALEQDASDMESIHSVFRGFHTIKGLAGFLELSEIRDVAHEVETLLDLARETRLAVTPDVIDVVLASTDYLSRWLDHLEARPGEPAPADVSDNEFLLGRVRRMMEGGEPQPAEAPVAVAAEARSSSDPGVEKSKAQSRVVKVDTNKLDFLVDMVGELVIAQSMVRHDPDLAASQKPQLTRNLSQLARITDEVQRTAMSMRMVTIGPLFQKMARLVRDLTRRFNKPAHFETQGEDVQLDRNIVEELADPLMHMVRNSVDHGIDTPEERVAAGKPPMARVALRAFHQSGQIVIQVSDDGRGLNREKILAKAVKNGLIAPNATISDQECFHLIFHPGFSTAEQVSDVSGRGVGMDVVKKQIQKLRGSIDIQSVQGKGTTFSLKLPLTLAIIDGLVVSVGAERFIVPIYSVREMLRPTPEMISRVEGRAEVVLVRDNLLPVIRLHERFGIPPRSTDPSECVMVVAEHDGRHFCLMVDELIGKQEVVIKSLGPVFQSVSGIAGGAILGDGRVGLILDIKGVFAN